MKTWFTITLLVLIAIGIGLAVLLVPPGVEPGGPISKQIDAEGSSGFRELPLALIDDSRPTNANGDYAGADSGALNGSLYLPADAAQAPYPLIVYSHGFMSSAEGARYYAEYLAPKGYVVAAVDYPLTHGDAPGGPNAYDVVHQPGDVSFLIDSLIAQSRTAGDELEGLIDADRIGAAGLSLGGLTTTLSAFHADLRDPRIRAAASIAGPAAFFTPQFFETSNLPFLMIAGTTDAIVPYEPNAASIPKLDDNAILITLDSASHVGFAAMAATLVRWTDHADMVVCPMLLANIDDGNEGEAPPPLLAPDESIGITDAPASAAPCQQEFTDARGPYEQLLLTRLALYAFFESAFSPDAGRRASMRDFLVTVYAAENAGTAVAVSTP